MMTTGFIEASHWVASTPITIKFRDKSMLSMRTRCTSRTSTMTATEPIHFSGPEPAIDPDLRDLLCPINMESKSKVCPFARILSLKFRNSFQNKYFGSLLQWWVYPENSGQQEADWDSVVFNLWPEYSEWLWRCLHSRGLWTANFAIYRSTYDNW